MTVLATTTGIGFCGIFGIFELSAITGTRGSLD
jgi:hypothetical protein